MNFTFKTQIPSLYFWNLNQTSVKAFISQEDFQNLLTQYVIQDQAHRT